MIYLGLFLLLLGITIFFTFHKLKAFYQLQPVPHQRTPAALGLSFHEVHFPTRNNRRLYGWWVPTSSDKVPREPGPTIILLHGWGVNLESMLPYIEHLQPAGFNLLAFDARQHGSSDQDEFSSLLKFAEDTQAALDYVRHREEVDPARLALLGFSFGAAAAIYVAAHDERVKATVAIGSFAHPVEMMRRDFKRKHIPYFPLVPLIFKYYQKKIGITFDELAPVNNIPHLKGRLFIIHGQEDRVVPLSQARRLQETTQRTKADSAVWLVPGKGHFDISTHPEFWPKIIAFLEEAL